MIYFLILKILVIIGFAMGMISIEKITWIFLEAQISKVKDYFSELQFKRRQPFIKTHTHATSNYFNILGLSFGTQAVYEQDYYLNLPVGEARLVSTKRIFAPEVRADKWAPQLLTLALKKYLPLS